MKPLILASSSPRRKEILTLAGLSFEVLIPSCTEEDIPLSEPGAYVRALSRLKCEAGLREASQLYADAVVTGADTIVWNDGAILGKPADEAQALAMLKSLSGRTHTVYTGVTAADLRSGRMETFHEATHVTFYPLTDREILDYIATKEPLDKAGAYGIQGRGAYLVKEICGDYFNVVGLPIARLMRLIARLQEDERKA